MSELKPCPFCGGAARAFKRTCDKDTRYDPADRAFPIVRCGACGACSEGDNWTELQTAIDRWNRRAQPAQAGQVLTDEEIDAAYEKARTDYQRSRFAVRGQQLTAQDSPDWWFARAIEQTVLAKRVPMTESAWQNPLHPDQISDKPIPNWTPLYRLMSKISDPSNAQHFSAEAAVKAFGTVGEKGGA